MFEARTSKALLTALAASLALAGTASADSLVYLQGGDVWLATADAGRQFQVTGTGGYTAVSQADDGTILATTTAGTLRRLTRQGRTLSDITTPVTGANNGPFSFKGPYDADISPNGAKAAYGFTYTGYTGDYNGGTWVNEGNASGFTRSDRSTSIAETGFKQNREYDHPEWIDDQMVMLSNGPGYPSDPFAIVEAGSGNSRSWFTDPNNMHPHDATVSRNKRLIAATNGDRSRVHVYRDGDAALLGTVYDCFYYQRDRPSMRMSSPTMNANGTMIAFADGEGLEIAPIPSAAVACPQGQNSRAVLPGASSPDWGPSDVPTSRTEPLPGATPVPTPTPAPTATPVVTPAPTATPVPTPKPSTGPNATPTPKPTTAPAPTATPAPPATPAPTASPVPTTAATPTPVNGYKDVVRDPGADLGKSGNGTPGSDVTQQGSDGELTVTAPSGKLGKALKSGLRVTVSVPAAGKVQVAVRSGGKVVATGSVTPKRAGAATATVTFSAAAKRKLAKVKKATFAIAVTQGSHAAAVTATLRR